MPMNQKSIASWLSRDREPADLYELLGRPRFDPDRAELKEAILAAYAELLPYQNHADAAIAQRAVKLQMELGRAEGTLSDPNKLRSHHKAIIARLQDLYSGAIGQEVSIETPEGLRAWLSERHFVHPDRCNDVVNVLQSVFGSDSALDSLLDMRHIASPGPKEPDTSHSEQESEPTEEPRGDSSVRVFRPRPAARDSEEDGPSPPGKPELRRTPKPRRREAAIPRAKPNARRAPHRDGAAPGPDTEASPEGRPWSMPLWTERLSASAKWLAQNWHRDVPLWATLGVLGSTAVLLTAFFWLLPSRISSELLGEHGNLTSATAWQGELLDVWGHDGEIHLTVELTSGGEGLIDAFVEDPQFDNENSFARQIKDYKARNDSRNGAAGDQVLITGMPSGREAVRHVRPPPVHGHVRLATIERVGEPRSRVTVGEPREPETFAAIPPRTPLDRALRIHPPTGTKLSTPAIFGAHESGGTVRLLAGQGASSADQMVRVHFDGVSSADFAAYRLNDAVQLEAIVSEETQPRGLVLHGLSLRRVSGAPSLVQGRYRGITPKAQLGQTPGDTAQLEQSPDDMRRWQEVRESLPSHVGERFQLVGCYGGIARSGSAYRVTVQIERLFGQSGESLSCWYELPPMPGPPPSPAMVAGPLGQLSQGESVQFEVEVTGGTPRAPQLALVWLAPLRAPQRRIHFPGRGGPAGYPMPPRPPTVPFPAPESRSRTAATAEAEPPGETKLPPLRDFTAETQAWRAIGSEPEKHFGRRLEMYGRFQQYREDGKGQRSVRIAEALGRDSITCQCDPSSEAEAFLSGLRDGEHVLFEVVVTGSGRRYSTPSPFTLLWIARRESPLSKIACSPMHGIQLPELDLAEHGAQWERFRGDPEAHIGRTLFSAGRYVGQSDEDEAPQVTIRPHFLPYSKVDFSYLGSTSTEADLSRLEPDQDVLFELAVTGGRSRYPEVSLLWMAPLAQPDTKTVFAEDVSELPGRRLLSLNAHQRGAAAIAWSADGKYLATCGRDESSVASTKVWDAHSGELLHTIQEPTRRSSSAQSVHDVVWMSPHPLLAIGTTGAIRVWSLQTRSETAAFGRSMPGQQVTSLAWNETDEFLAAGTQSGALYLIRHNEKPTRRTRMRETHSGPIQSLALRPDGSGLASGHSRSGVWVWNLNDELPTRGLGSSARLRDHLGKMLIQTRQNRGAEDVVITERTDPNTERTDPNCEMLAWSPDGTRLAIASNGLEVWDLSDPNENRLLYQESSSNYMRFTAVQFSPDGRLLASADRRGNVFLWEADTGAPIFQWNCEYVVDLRFDPTGTRLATASGSGKPVRVWSVGEPK